MMMNLQVDNNSGYKTVILESARPSSAQQKHQTLIANNIQTIPMYNDIFIIPRQPVGAPIKICITNVSIEK